VVPLNGAWPDDQSADFGDVFDAMKRRRSWEEIHAETFARIRDIPPAKLDALDPDTRTRLRNVLALRGELRTGRRLVPNSGSGSRRRWASMTGMWGSWTEGGGSG
jgi:hypothetical protein